MTKKNYNFLIMLYGIGLSLLSYDVNAATTTSTLPVTASVPASCTITSSTPLAFGSFTGTQLDAQVNIQVNCTNGLTYSLDMDAGAGSGATVTTRVLTTTTTPSSTLNYTIYKDTGRTVIWKTGTGNNVTGTGTGASQAITAYGRIAAITNPVVGSYADTVTITMTYP